jgi:two-component system, sensor histidine kinase
MGERLRLVKARHEVDQLLIHRLAANDSALALEPSSARDETPKQDALPRGRILVVDDNKDARNSLATFLTSMGYSVCTARDSVSALEAAQTLQPQLAILDIVMPGGSGFKTAELLRRQPALSTIIIVSVTGWQDEMDGWLSRHAGCDYHLLKPLEVDKLEPILQLHLPL